MLYIHHYIKTFHFWLKYILLLLPFLRFYFFKIQKVVSFYVFCRVSYVFSNYDWHVGALRKRSEIATGKLRGPISKPIRPLPQTGGSQPPCSQSLHRIAFENMPSAKPPIDGLPQLTADTAVTIATDERALSLTTNSSMSTVTAYRLAVAVWHHVFSVVKFSRNGSERRSATCV